MQLENVEIFYPLSPLQAGMLFHSVSSPASRVYYNQVIASMQGELDVPAFERAWQRVIDRHPILRSFCVWEGLQVPIQVVERHARLPFKPHDCQGMSQTEQQTRLESIIKIELERLADLSKAPLMGVALVRTADDCYEFIWSFHHILLDGWSMFLIFKEVFAFYEAFRKGQELHLGRPRTFRDYIAWLQRQDLLKAESYWRKTLKGFTKPTLIRTGRVLADREENIDDIDTHSLQLSTETTSALKTLCKQHHLTLNTLIQASWALLLSHYNDDTDVVYGSVVSGRPADMSGIESMVGLFINTLPVRVQVLPGDSLLDFLKKIQDQQVELREYEYSPLVDVQGWSDVSPGQPLFESVLLFENYPKDVPLEEMGQSLEITNVRWVERVNYPLVALAVQESKLLLRIIYHCKRFDASTITRMLGHWCTLLEGMITAPKCRLIDLPMLTKPERNQLLVEWNSTFTEDQLRVGECVHELFEKHALHAPEAVAVAYEGTQLTYQELNNRANQLAHYLHGLGVGPEVLVSICMPRSLEMVIGIMGILKAGGAYVPLDPENPMERLGFMLEDAQTPVLLTQECWLTKLSTLWSHSSSEPTISQMKSHPEVVCLDTDWKLIAQESVAQPVSKVALDKLAYVIYTSGSTGQPKGVAISHHGLRSLVLWHNKAFKIKHADRATLVATQAFDASVWELWPYLAAGASIHIAPLELIAAPEQLRDWLIAQEITISFLPTPLAEYTLTLDWPAKSALRTLLTGGDKLHNTPPASLPFEVVNNYGPTENTVVTTSGVISSGVQAGIAPTIGRPIAGTQVYLLDKHMHPVPVGVSGELYIGGNGLARGYLNHPELTAEKFVPDPFSKTPGKRLYKTGDLARYLPNGNIEFIDRIDHQVKIRGFRIELGEIEMALLKHTEVREAVVLARDENPRDKTLIAYVIPDKKSDLARDTEIKDEDLKSKLGDFLRQQLPDYMIPSAFVVLDTFPLTSRGKLDRQRLPAPEKLHRELDAAHVAPRTDIERTIAAVWQEVLHTEKVGVHDNFFDLGGHSLRLIQVHSRLRDVIARDLSIIEMFRYPTINSLAKHLSLEQAQKPSFKQKQKRADFRQASINRREKVKERRLRNDQNR